MALMVKLIKEVQGKSGVYPIDIWLPAKIIDGLLFISYPDKQFYMKRIERSNVKEYKNE